MKKKYLSIRKKSNDILVVDSTASKEDVHYSNQFKKKAYQKLSWRRRNL